MYRTGPINASITSEDEEEDINNEQEIEFRNLLETSRPKDRFYLIYIVFLLFGLNTSLPWNLFITANGFWMYKFRDLNNSHPYDPNYKSDLQTTFSSYLSIGAMVPTVAFLLVNALISTKIRFQIRLVGALIGIQLLLILTLIFTEINTDSWQHLYFVMTMLVIVLLNSFSAIFNGALMGLASCFPSSYVQSTMNGQSIAGVFSTFACIISIAVGISEQNSSFIYFLSASILVFIIIIAYFHLNDSRFYRSCLETMTVAEKRVEIMSSQGHQMPFKNILKKIWVHGFCGFLGMATTISVYPAITVLVVSQNVSDHSPITNEYFIPVCCFLIFNFGDLTGKVLSGFLKIPTARSKFLPVLPVLRLVFIPLIMLCNVQPRSSLPVVFQSDASFVIIILAFAISNGYVANLAMLYGSKQVETGYQQVVGAIIAFCMGSGLAFGAVISYGLVKLL